MNDAELLIRLEAALAITREAGRGVVRHFVKFAQRRAADPEIKSDGTPVTAADREAESVIRERVANLFPRDGILGEEFGESSGESGYRWVIDPIDGTASFICGVPLFATLIGIERNGQPVAGVIHLPALGESVSGAHGFGAMHHVDGHQPRIARVSSIAKLHRASFVSTSVDYFIQSGKAALYNELVSAARISRGFGDAYAFALVATGRADFCVEPGVKPWDIAAVGPVIDAAGGRWSDFHGNIRTDGGSIVASNGVLHEAVLSMIARSG